MAALNGGLGGMVAGAAIGGAIGNAASTAGQALGLGKARGKRKGAAGGGTADPLLEGGLAALPGFFNNPRAGAEKPEPIGTGGGADQVGVLPKGRKRRPQPAPGTVLTGKSGMTGGANLPPGVQTLGGTKTVLGA